MRASPLTSRLKRCLAVRDWPWSRLPPLLRWYVATPPVVALIVIAVLAGHTDWQLLDLAKFLLFTAASISLAYVAASFAFRWFPPSFAGEHVGSGLHAFTWALAVAACYILGGRI